MENYVIVRADRAGVFFGQLVERNGSDVKMKNVRKIHYWDGAAAVEQIAVDGVNSSSRLTITVPEMEIMGAIQVIPCSAKAVENLKAIPEWKR